MAYRPRLKRIYLKHLPKPGRRAASRTKSTYRDLVTKADLSAEKDIVSTLRRAFPGFGFLAEEGTHVGTDNLWTWVIDPLDGTVNFRYGIPIFSASICLLHRGLPALGWVYVPMQNETFYARRDGGAWLNGARVRVGRTARIRDSLISTGFPYARNRNFKNNLRIINRLLPRARDMRRQGVASIDLAYVAAGRLDGYFESGLAPWDVAAGGLIVEEAGGKVTDWNGGPGWLNNRQIIAANPRLHGLLKKEIAACGR